MVGALPLQDTTSGQAPPVPAGFAGGGGNIQGANAAFAIGDVGNAYQRAQLNDVNQKAALGKASRDRLTQIWETGTTDPNVQQDPKVHASIAQLYKNMGVPVPVLPNGTLDWNAMAPVKDISTLSVPMLQMIGQMQPADRRNFVQSSHILGFTDDMLDAPAQATQQRLGQFQNDLTKITQGGGMGKMSGGQLMQWAKANKTLFDQAMGPDAYDQFINDPSVFATMSANAQTQMNKIADTAAEIQARTKGINGLTPEAMARINKDNKQAQEASDLGGLAKIRTQYVKGEVSAYPQLIQAQIKALTDGAQAHAADAVLAGQKVIDLQATGGSIGAAKQLLTTQLAAANDVLRSATQVWTNASTNYGMTPEVQSVYDTALSNVNAIQDSLSQLSKKDVITNINAANAKRITGNTTTPVDASKPNNRPAWKPTKNYGGEDIQLEPGKGWVNKAGKVVWGG